MEFWIKRTVTTCCTQRDLSISMGQKKRHIQTHQDSENIALTPLSEKVF